MLSKFLISMSSCCNYLGFKIKCWSSGEKGWYFEHFYIKYGKIGPIKKDNINKMFLLAWK